MKRRFLKLALSVLASSFMIGSDAMSKSEGAKRTEIDTVIIHTIGGPNPECPNGKLEFSPATKDSDYWKNWFEEHDILSIHYIIDKDGNTATSLPEDKIAIHAKGLNEKSIGIELVHPGDGQTTFTDKMITALNKLLRQIAKRHSLTPGQIKAHSDLDDRKFSCGGTEYKMKMDPGSNFPWDEVLSGIKF